MILMDIGLAIWSDEGLMVMTMLLIIHGSDNWSLICHHGDMVLVWGQSMWD